MKLRLLVIAIALLAACGDGKEVVDLDQRFDGAGVADPITDGEWFRPALQTTWHWQLSVPEGEEPNTRYDVDVYDLDLFETDAALIERLRSDGRMVICYFSAGSREQWRPDADQFDGADVGKTLDGWKGERWIDVRSEAIFELMLGRLELAVSKGCDGVEPDNVDGFTNRSGFHLEAADQLAYNRALANAAHERGLSIGLKNTGDLAGELEPYYDFSLNEECHRYDECGQLRPFTDADKPIWNAEYTDEDTLRAAEELSASVCPAAREAKLRTLILPLELDDRFRVSCDE